MSLSEKLVRDPVALAVASAGYRYFQGEELTEEEIEQWREAAVELGERYPRLRELDASELDP